MLKRFAFVAPLLALTAPALAQTADDAVKGVYVGAKELCDQAKSQSLQSVIEAGNTILTNQGLESIEFNCAFLQVLKNPRMPAGWVVTAMCEEPGYAYPEMFSLVERTPGELEVAVMSEAHGAYSLPSDDGQDAPGEEESQPQAEAAPSPPSPPSPPAQEEEGSGDADGEAYGLSGVWYRCDGVAAP
ncbi:MAG: hypothetical protein IT533_15905 [Hyphomicrobiales bacterium]|jgi:hypothetical protein|nr:hypothetical protein [Hyphomicrobiales bacterium]